MYSVRSALWLITSEGRISPPLLRTRECRVAQWQSSDAICEDVGLDYLGSILKMDQQKPQWSDNGAVLCSTLTLLQCSEFATSTYDGAQVSYQIGFIHYMRRAIIVYLAF